MLDEADKLCEKKNFKIVKEIFSKLDSKVQKLAYSATFSEDKLTSLESIIPNAKIISAVCKNANEEENNIE